MWIYIYSTHYFLPDVNFVLTNLCLLRLNLMSSTNIAHWMTKIQNYKQFDHHTSYIYHLHTSYMLLPYNWSGNKDCSVDTFSGSLPYYLQIYDNLLISWWKNSSWNPFYNLRDYKIKADIFSILLPDDIDTSRQRTAKVIIC